MNSKRISATVLFALAVLLIGANGCSNDDVTNPPSGGGGTSGVVVSSANPVNGDGTLTASATMTVNAGSSGYDEANLSQSLGSGVGHDLTVTWDTTTHAINAVNEGWFDGTVGGNTLCLAGTNPCDTTKVAVDFANHKVTFTGLVLPDAFGGTATATLTGTMVW